MQNAPTLNLSYTMKQTRTLILFIFAVNWLGLSAQTAPDFTVTDSWGQPHSLYADYLNQGKTVVLKIFYVACPPCNSIAPFLEPLYQDWGGGQADVQFIELSIKQNDTDAMVNNYKSMHGTTYPAAGGQGNSVAATIPYTNGTFGLWTGTPTFVVIAPDGTLDYDVYGVGNSGTVAALDAAIAATGADGSITAVENTIHEEAITLVSNLVANELTLQSKDFSGDFRIEILNPFGHSAMKLNGTMTKGTDVKLDVSELTAGTWICRINDQYNRIMASYLFVKI